MSGILTAPGLYCELHAHSTFSLLDGVPFPEQLVERAVELGLLALALTDHDSASGLPPFYVRARELSLKPILGAELTLEDDSHLTLLAESNEGYANLCQLITAGQLNSPKGQSRLPWNVLPQHTDGLICLTGCRRGPVARHLILNNTEAASKALTQLTDLFGRKNVFVELQRNLRRDDMKLSRRLAGLAQQQHLPIVATGNVHYLSEADADLQSALVSIRERVPLPRAQKLLRPNREYFMRSAAGMAALFPDLPEAVRTTRIVAERCEAELPRGTQLLPQIPTPPGLDANGYLRQLCTLNLNQLYPHNTQEASALLEKELALIEQLKLGNYFLVVWDIVMFCQKNNILCHGRGSAANSLVAHLLGISAVDPIAQELVVERFISVEHNSTPDIDLDIEAGDQRERVIQYVYERWGRSHAAMACTFITYRSASAIRDAGYALGFKAETIEEVAKVIEGKRRAEELDEDGRVEHVDTPITELAQATHKLTSVEWQRLVTLAAQLQRRPRHLGIHSGGMIVSGPLLSRLVPVEPATMKDRTVVQFDKEWLESLGIVKIDLLGLRMLAAIADTLTLILKTQHKSIDVRQLRFEDAKVYDLICSARTIGLFQVESGAQVSLIPYMQPRCFQDLVAEVSLIRPGPLQGGMVRPYVRRRQGLEPITFVHPLLKPALAETLGVVVFQEQIIKVAVDVGGFAPGRGELLRRALGHKNAAEAIERFRNEFLLGARAKGVPEKTAFEIWQMIAGFAGYSFSKAHAAAFACIVYWSAWLRLYYPTEYFCGLLRHAPLGTYPARVLESEANRVGVRFLPFDVNFSMVQPTVERGAIRHGLNYIKSLGEDEARFIVQARGEALFDSLVDFVRRTGISRRTAEWIAQAGALDSFGERRQVLWDLAEAFDVVQRPPPLPLIFPEETAEMPAMNDEQKLMATFAATSVTGGLHLAEVRRDAFKRAGCWPYAQLQKTRLGSKVKVGGLVADGVRRPPTAHGTAFLRLENRDGFVDVIIPQDLYLVSRDTLHSVFLIVEGVLKRQGAVISVEAKKIQRLS